MYLVKPIFILLVAVFSVCCGCSNRVTIDPESVPSITPTESVEVAPDGKIIAEMKAILVQVELELSPKHRRLMDKIEMFSDKIPQLRSEVLAGNLEEGRKALKICDEALQVLEEVEEFIPKVHDKMLELDVLLKALEATGTPRAMRIVSMVKVDIDSKIRSFPESMAKMEAANKMVVDGCKQIRNGFDENE